MSQPTNTAQHPPILALDAGQSGVRALIVVDGEQVFEGDYPAVLTDRLIVPQLAAIAGRAITDSGVAARDLCVGSTGLDPSETPQGLLDQVSAVGITRVFLAHDSITSYLGALGDQPGVVVAAGTGMVTLAVGDERVLRVDGWGYLIGDAGSGFWIGRAALDGVMRSHDGRGADTSLTGPAQQEFPDLEQAYLTIQADELKVSRVARYAKIVSEHAAAGDAVSIEISNSAAAELAHTAISGLESVGQGERPDPAVSWVGNVFKNQLLETHFRELIEARFPHARFVPAAGSGLLGAAALAAVGPDSALYPRIARA